MEEALRATSADTLKRITDTLAKEMEEKKRQKRLQDEAEEDEEIRRRQVRSAERHQGEQERRPVTPEEEVRSPSTSLSPTPQHFNAKVKTSNDGSDRSASPRGNFSFLES